MFEFELKHRDAITGARRGVFFTPHGEVQTPGFMPVGTQGTVKGITIDQVAATGAHRSWATRITLHYVLATKPFAS